MASNEEQTLSPEDALSTQPHLAPQLTTGNPEPQSVPAGMFRRMAALVYDALLVVAMLMISTLPFLPFTQGKVLVPEEVGALAYVYRAWELVIVVLFFGFFWTRRGQTLGMQAWRLRIEDDSGRLLAWPRAVLRQVYAVLPWMPAFLVLSYASEVRSPAWQLVGEILLAPGFVDWAAIWFDGRRRTFHDRFTGTRVVVLPKTAATKAVW